MVVIRPIEVTDLGSLVELAGMATYGLTSLPKDEQLLAQRIEQSVRAFEHPVRRPGGEKYLFVLEDQSSQRIIGTTGIISKAGGFEPNWGYQIQTITHASKMLKVSKQIKVLHLVAEHDGPCEIGSLFLSPKDRQPGYGRLLSVCRFLFMAQFPQAFDPNVMAEMRGVIGDDGHSPFWEAVGRHFFDIDFPSADYLSMVNKKFIAELMPRYPLYIPLLPYSAQSVIGQVHDRTKPALRMLQTEGFAFNDMVDIFEAGPYVTCELANIRAVRQSLVGVVGEINDDRLTPEDPPQVIGTTQWKFRACLGAVKRNNEQDICIKKETAEALQVRIGDAVRYVAPRPPEPEAVRS